MWYIRAYRVRYSVSRTLYVDMICYYYEKIHNILETRLEKYIKGIENSEFGIPSRRQAGRAWKMEISEE